MRTRTARVSGLLIAAVLGALVAPAWADDAPYVGTWSLDPTDCQTGQESENAPLVLAKDRYDQHESHCTFKSVAGKDSDWKIAAECTAQGAPLAYDFTLTVSGDTLTFTDSGGARDFLRCK